MSYRNDDTICAVASAPSGAARGILRVSGRDAVHVAAQVFHADDGKPVERIRLATAVSGCMRVERLDAYGELSIPGDLYVWPTDRSYTREPVAELHLLGSPPLIGAVSAAACRAGARLAEPGEFTLRAFLAGRIDLTQAEAVLGVIDARSGDEFDDALKQLAGGISLPLHRLREGLLQLLAEVEAGLDFVDEDIEFISTAKLLDRLHSAIELLGEIADQMKSRHFTNDRPQVALLGAPNAGKSSLFNALVARWGAAPAPATGPNNAALVSAQRGTTRDYLSATISLNEIACDLTDTAGLDDLDQDDAIQLAAQRFATERRNQATIRAWCVDASDASSQASRADCDLLILTKSDLATNLASDQFVDVPTVITSSFTGEGLEECCDAIWRLLNSAPADNGQLVSATAKRCFESTRLSQESLQRAAQMAASARGNELIAVELRAALAELGKVVGAVYTDDLLDRIFKTFCIGK